MFSLRLCGSNSFDFQSVIFDHGIAQKFVRGFVERFARGFLVGGVEFDLEIFADVDGFDAAMAHVFEGFQDGDALRVNDGFFRGDDDFCFHARAKKILRKNFRRSEEFLKNKDVARRPRRKMKVENFSLRNLRVLRATFETLNFSAHFVIVHA